MENRTVEVLAILGAAYPGFELTEFTVGVYIRTLEDLSQEELTQAAYYHIMNNKWFPTIAEIRQAVIEIRRLSGDFVTAVEAWGKVQEEIQRVHASGTPELDAVTTRVVNGLGWRNMCMSNEDDSILRAHFIKAYDQIMDRHIAKIKTPIHLLQLEAGNALSIEDRAE